MPGARRNGVSKGVYLSFGKRLADIVMAGLLLVALLLPLAVVTLIIRLSLGSPVLFRQTRLGMREKHFEILKFRTMTGERDASGNLLPTEQRVTLLGRLLRKISLDELPQLWNVLRGDMSIVGPRPLYPYYLPYYTKRERRRHEVRPGITGLAQIRGRKLLDWDSRLNLDAQYVEQISLMLDVRILAATLFSVLSTRGSESDPSAKQPTLAEHRKVEFVDHQDAQEPVERGRKSD